MDLDKQYSFKKFEECSDHKHTTEIPQTLLGCTYLEVPFDSNFSYKSWFWKVFKRKLLYLSNKIKANVYQVKNMLESRNDKGM